MRVETVQDGPIQLRFNGFDIYLADDLFGKAVGQQIARQFRVQAATD